MARHNIFSRLSSGESELGLGHLAKPLDIIGTLPIVLLLADEPTGALDLQTGKDILALFQELNTMGNTIIMITHDLKVAQHSK